MFFIAIVLCILRLLRLKTEGQAIYRKIPRKVTKVNRNFRLSWASLIGLCTTRPRSSAFKLGFICTLRLTEILYRWRMY